MTHKGWHNRGYIPHFDVGGLVQHIVLRTAHSLPEHVLVHLEAESVSARRARIDAALDQSELGRIFNDKSAAETMVNALRHFCGLRYDCLAWCVMPNHVHVVVLVYSGHSLGQTVRSWKRFVTREINHARGMTGPIFAPDYFDRYMRNGAQTERAIAYVENNPVAAGLCVEPQDWPWSSAFEHASGWYPKVDKLPVWLPQSG